MCGAKVDLTGSGSRLVAVFERLGSAKGRRFSVLRRKNDGVSYCVVAGDDASVTGVPPRYGAVVEVISVLVCDS